MSNLFTGERFIVDLDADGLTASLSDPPADKPGWETYQITINGTVIKYGTNRVSRDEDWHALCEAVKERQAMKELREATK